MKKYVDGVLVDLSATDETVRQSDITNWNNIKLSELELAMLYLREKRDKLIAETDYLALSDQTLSAEMSTYRQALRDITNGITTVEQANNVTWPTKP